MQVYKSWIIGGRYLFSVNKSQMELAGTSGEEISPFICSRVSATLPPGYKTIMGQFVCLTRETYSYQLSSAVNSVQGLQYEQSRLIDTMRLAIVRLNFEMHADRLIRSID